MFAVLSMMYSQWTSDLDIQTIFTRIIDLDIRNVIPGVLNVVILETHLKNFNEIPQIICCLVNFDVTLIFSYNNVSKEAA